MRKVRNIFTAPTTGKPSEVGTSHGTSSDAGSTSERLDYLRKLIYRVGELLPAQGPISAFVFLNTLQGLEEMPFDAGVRRGARLFGCQPYMNEDFYRERLEKGRIRLEDIAAVLRFDLGAAADEPLGEGGLAELGTKFELRLAMAQHRLRHGPAEELRWFVAETDALTKLREEMEPAARDRFIEETRHWIMRDMRNGGSGGLGKRGGPHEILKDQLKHYGEASIERWPREVWETLSLQALWRICREGCSRQDVRIPSQSSPIRHRDLLLEATSEDSDVLVHELMIRYCAAFADQGFADWALPDRNLGFFAAFCRLYGRAGGPPDSWLHDLPELIAEVTAAGMTPLEIVLDSLDKLGVSVHELDDYVAATVLALRGWAGLLHQMEVRPDRVPLSAPPDTLIEFLALRLLLDRVALAYVAKNEMGFTGPLDELRAASLEHIEGRPTTTVEQRAFLVLQIAEALEWHPSKLYQLSKLEWAKLLEEIEAFGELERRRVMHLAFERRYRRDALDAISIHTDRPVQRVEAPRFQISFCIDAREESFRRHIEEIAPDVETFAAPGFYCVPIYYRGASDAYFSTLCPIVVRPQHWLVEEVVYTLEEEHRRRAEQRKRLGEYSHRVHVGTRTATRGAILTGVFGVLASVPLVARVLFPRLTASIRSRAGRFVEAPKVTRLRLERTAEKPSPEDTGIGFTIDEMANFGERVLRDIGLTSGFARLVIFLGHGSYCLNNPHKAAYDCGACSGAAGGPNARALAAFLNNPRAREIIASRGLKIPSDTYFLGGEHNTCTDAVTFFDLDLLPKSHHKDLESARQTLDQACDRNAHERCRRFQSAALNLTPAQARRHVQGRAEDLAQTRPEFGNASNALCFVGRRDRVRGLYMDRRAFMHSYDPTQDDAEATILGRILGPVVVVCSGINLQYYFSYVDSTGWGCGTKLPHNVTSLLGVMDGHASDLRSGLPWQGVEIHEPMRLLFVFEAKPEALFKIMGRNPLVNRVLRNQWAQLALLDPDSNKISLFRGGEFVPYTPSSTELPQAASSVDWYRGWREHLGFAQIGLKNTATR
jgi:uncharacterized protein YbcC (UPF0753/DUF2309 family)